MGFISWLLLLFIGEGYRNYRTCADNQQLFPLLSLALTKEILYTCELVFGKVINFIGNKMVKKKKVATKAKTTAAKTTATKTTKKAAKVAKKTTAKAKTSGRDMLIVGSKSKEVLKGFGLNVASDALAGLNEVVYWYLKSAAKRTEANGRKTVRAHDFHI
jgi:hypothetical protein